MNQKEISELKRRFRLGKNAISHICGCYVNSRKKIVSYLNEPLDRMPEEEAEKYLNLLKKALSGTLGRNLIDIVFSTQQVADSDEHRRLMTLRDSKLKDGEVRQEFYQAVIDSLDMGESNYLMLDVVALGELLIGSTLPVKAWMNLDIPPWPPIPAGPPPISWRR